MKAAKGLPHDAGRRARLGFAIYVAVGMVLIVTAQADQGDIVSLIGFIAGIALVARAGYLLARK